MDQIVKTDRIRSLNDSLRRTFCGGRVMLTNGILSLSEQARQQIIAHVRAFETFNEDNDSHGEHDFGSFKIDGHTINWKIDYYDLDYAMGSPDPADSNVTRRVLTIMLTSEY